MVTRGKIRSNGSQLADYLLNKNANENVKILEIKGTLQPNNLKQSLLEMSLTSELTKSNSGLYHAQLCPAYGDGMSEDQWKMAVDILAEELGFSSQKRVLVLHEKKGKKHLHVAFERYNHETGKMISNKFSRLAQDRARMKIELALNHKRTPERNTNRPRLKSELSTIWQQTKTGEEFMKLAQANGYTIAAGTQRPYMVIDETGRSFNLLRQLDNVKTSEVRNRFRQIKLIQEKTAIESIRKKQKEKRTILKTAFIENVIGEKDVPKVVANDNQKNPQKTYSMKINFNVDLSSQQNFNEQKSKEELIKERLRRAKIFRENERSL